MTVSSRTRVCIAAAAVLGAGVTGLAATTAVASGATGPQAQPEPTVSSVGPSASAEPPALVLEAAGLAVGTTDQGDLYGEGPAPVVKAAAGLLHDLGVNEVVGYSGAGETGTAATVITGNTAPRTCLDAPPTLPAIRNLDDLTPAPVQVRNGSCANPGKPDGATIGAGADADLPATADWMTFIL